MHINNDFQRITNTSHVLEAVWRNNKISRSDISSQLGLYRSTVSNIINSLIEQNIILEGYRGKATEKGGRKPVHLKINENFGCIIGMELQPDSYNITAISFNKDPLYSQTGKLHFNEKQVTPGTDSVKLFEDTIHRLLSDVISKVKIRNIPIYGISIGIPGIIDIDRGIIIRSDPFNLVNYDFGKAIGNKYSVPLLIENDAKCCAWLQLAQNEHIYQKDFLCVLAKNHDDKIDNGIGIGLSILMNGRIINGHNFGAGEYISSSWRTNKQGQTGLPQAVISTVTTVDDSYREWVKDLFQTLTTTIPLLEPNFIFLHGQGEQRKQLILDTIHSEVSQFEAVCERCSSQLIIMDDDNYEIAQGAAYMFIQKLFETPSLDKPEQYSNLQFEELLQHKI